MAHARIPTKVLKFESAVISNKRCNREYALMRTNRLRNSLGLYSKLGLNLVYLKVQFFI